MEEVITEMPAKHSENQKADYALARVAGKSLLELPKDLYIPPDALKIFLEAFEGPLDLLLYLIKRQDIDILNIPITAITKQYIEYVEVMHELQIELAADYLVMAASLAEIKSRMLLPRPVVNENESEDPRAELVRRLQEYERFKKAAETLGKLPQLGRDFYATALPVPEFQSQRPLPVFEFKELILALKNVLQRAKLKQHHHIKLENLSVRERMAEILHKLDSDKFLNFIDFFNLKEGRLGVVVTFLAMLELVKQSLIEIVQNQMFGPIHLKRAA